MSFREMSLSEMSSRPTVASDVNTKSHQLSKTLFLIDSFKDGYRSFATGKKSLL